MRTIWKPNTAFTMNLLIKVLKRIEIKIKESDGELTKDVDDVLSCAGREMNELILS